MCKISSNGYNTGVTIISNLFLDKIMPDTSEQDLKVYLYLLRYAYVPSAEISLSQIAKALDLTSNKVVKSLKYWEAEGILEFSLDTSGEIESIRLNDINNLFNNDITSAIPKISGSEPSVKDIAGQDLSDNVESDASDSDSLNISSESNTKEPDEKQITLPVYTCEELYSITENDAHFSKIYSQVEGFMAPKTFGHDDIETLAGIINGLDFSDDVIVHLYDYCCNKKGKRNYKYISKVARNWAARNIKTVDDAKYTEQFFDEFLIELKNMLGFNVSFGTAQLEKISEWIYSYGMDKEVILEGFRLAKESHNDKPYKYAVGIINNWHKENVHTLNDVEISSQKHKEEMESLYAGNKDSSAKKSGSYNQFNDFEQRGMTKEEADSLTCRLMARNHSPEKLAAFKARLAGQKYEGV